MFRNPALSVAEQTVGARLSLISSRRVTSLAVDSPRAHFQNSGAKADGIVLRKRLSYGVNPSHSTAFRVSPGKSRSRGDLSCPVKIGFQYKDLPRLFLRCLGLRKTDRSVELSPSPRQPGVRQRRHFFRVRFLHETVHIFILSGAKWPKHTESHATATSLRLSVDRISRPDSDTYK